MSDVHKPDYTAELIPHLQVRLDDIKARLVYTINSIVLLALVAHAEDVMERHHVESQGYCNRCEHAVWPCIEVRSLVKAWST